MMTTPEDLTPAAAATPAADLSKLTGRLRAILAVVLIADVLDLMDSTITNIAAPTIVRHIGGGESLIKWLGASYALALGVLLVVGGRLGDRYGRRRMFLIGIAGFTLASLACGLSPDPAFLIVSRFVQGGFGALLIPQGIGLLTTTFSREQLPRAFAAFGSVLGGSAVLGPIAAGFIISADIAGLTWRPIFLINIVLGSIGFAAAARLLPRDEAASEVRIDGLGAGLLAASMLGLIYGLIAGSTDGWTAVPIASLAAGAALLGAFAVRQRVASEPLILPSLLRNRGFSSGLLLGLAFFAAVNGLAYVISLFFQLALGLSASRAAIGLTPLMIGIIISSFVSRPLIPKLGRSLVVSGLLATVAGAAGLWLTVHAEGTGASPLTMAPSVLVLGLGMGACFSSIYDVAIGDIAPAEAGSASGSLSAVQQLASAIGSAVVTTVYFTQLRDAGSARAMTTSVAVVGGITILCLALVWLLPRQPQPEPAPEGNQS
ncbi:MAG TPA: MFS transporter [Streptosporangiaceae bacterium]|jgi:EmrB/QacA subfamily drug resistance transporter|nr:MFS transporter [Streptosporangiaceae bacterium]